MNELKSLSARARVVFSSSDTNSLPYNRIECGDGDGDASACWFFSVLNISRSCEVLAMQHTLEWSLLNF